MSGDHEEIGQEYILRDLIDQFPNPILVISPQGEAVAFNRSFSQIMRCEAEELVALLQAQRFPQMVAARYPTDDSFHRLEAEIMDREGHSLQMVLRLYRSGCGQYYYVLVTDVAQKEKSAEATLHQRALYRLIAENATELIAVVDALTLEIGYANPAYLKKAGFTREEVLRENIMFFIHPEDRELCLQAIQEGVRRGEGKAIYRNLRKDGTFFWAEVTGRLFAGPDGHQQGLLITRDIHDRKLAEEALYEREARLREISEVMMDGIVCLDQNLIIEYISPSCRNFFGNDYQNRLRQKVTLDYVHPEDRDKVARKILEVLETSLPGRLEFRVKDAEGRYFWLEALGKVLCDDQGNFYKLVTGLRDIDPRRAAETARQYWEEKYRLIIENSLDGISILDLETFFSTYANPAILEILGYSWGEIVGQDTFGLIHPDDVAGVWQALWEGMQKGEGNVEYRLRKKDGSYLWWEVRGRVLPGAERKKALLFFRHITERKVAEEALRASEQRLRQITDNMLDAVACMGPDYLFSYISPSHSTMLGWSEEDLLGKDNVELIHPEDREIVPSCVADLVAGLQPGSIEYRCQHVRGHYVWVESLGKALFSEDGTYAGVVFASRDISQRKIVEQELKEQLDYHNALLNNMNEFCYTYDGNMRVTFINQRMLDTTGMRAEEVIGRNILEFVPPEEREAVAAMARMRLAGRENPGRYEHHLVVSEEKELLVRIKGTPLFNSSGDVVGGLILAEDITEYRKMEIEMARLAQLNTVGEIAAGIGHEIRNPMTTVKGFLQLMAKDDQFEDFRTYLDLMMEELDRANAIISEFLSLAKNKLIDLRPCQLNKLIETIYPLLQADAMIGDHSIYLALEDIPELLLDEKEIRQLILNLVRNALEATPPGKGVLISTRREAEDKVTLQVSDQGQGIPDEIMEKLGTPFFTTKENGTGLGLAVCYGIAERHRAAIQIETGAGGTTFLVHFPVPAGVLIDMDNRDLGD